MNKMAGFKHLIIFVVVIVSKSIAMNSAVNINFHTIQMR